MIMFQVLKRNRPLLNGKERPIRFISKAGFTSRIVNVLITYYAHRSCLCSYWKKYSEGKDFIIPSTFRDKLMFRFLLRTSFSLLIHLDIAQAKTTLWRVSNHFSVTLVSQPSPAKIYKCQKSCQGILFDWVPFSILYTSIILYIFSFVNYLFDKK